MSSQTPAVDDAKTKRCPVFKVQRVDHLLKPAVAEELLVTSTASASASAPDACASLGPLSSFKGTFQGVGFNTIFRPNSGPSTGTTFPTAVNPTPPMPPNENVLELNLTVETLKFGEPLCQVPNRGFDKQGDIVLNGVPYQQEVSDVTNLATGKGDRTPVGIHFENGLWMMVPASKNPDVPDSLCRMGSIPHGTTINAQCPVPTATIAGPPPISPVSLKPFVVDMPHLTFDFANTDASNPATARLPQDLSRFIAAGTITQDMLTDPTTVLRNALEGANITSFTVFTVSTQATAPLSGGGTANIAFLGPNAKVPQMRATFWVETVQHELVVPAWQPGQGPLRITPPAPNSSAPAGPTFVVSPPYAITEPKTIVVTWTQIQYSQVVFLDFNLLTWPHISVATLVPQDDQVVPASAWE